MRQIISLIICVVLLCCVALSEPTWPVFDENGYYSGNGNTQALEATRPTNTARPVQRNASKSGSDSTISLEIFIALVLALTVGLPAYKENKKNAYNKKAFNRWFYSKSCLDDVDRMSGRDFELYVSRLLLHNGYKKAYATKASSDKGADVIAIDRRGNKIAVQCKLYSKNVGIRAVQEAYSSMTYYHCSKSAVITNAHFTRDAKEFANCTGTILWDRDDLAKFVNKVK